MTQRFQQAYEALIEAFFNGTLAKFDCACCAVGNIVGKANNCAVSKEKFEEIKKFWKNRASLNEIDRVYEGTPFRMWHTYVGSRLFAKYLKEEVSNTGYTGAELRKVEKAFEENTKIPIFKYIFYSEQEILEDQYNGLCAVFEILMELDGIKDIDYKAKLQQKEGLVFS